MTPNSKPGYENRDASARVAFIAAGMLMLMVVVVGIVSRLILRAFSQAHPAQAVTLPPAPRLQTNPMSDFEALRAKEDQILDHYGWVDRSRGVVSIPIVRAMDLVAARGLPARHAAEAKE